MSWNKRNNRNNMHGATIKKGSSRLICCGSLKSCMDWDGSNRYWDQVEYSGCLKCVGDLWTRCSVLEDTVSWMQLILNGLYWPESES